MINPAHWVTLMFPISFCKVMILIQGSPFQLPITNIGYTYKYKIKIKVEPFCEWDQIT